MQLIYLDLETDRPEFIEDLTFGNGVLTGMALITMVNPRVRIR